MKKILMVFISGLLLSAVAEAEDWPQFCGPTRNNISAETGLLRSWPAEGPDVLWSVDVTTGFAGPAIKGGKVYLLGYANDMSQVRCLSLDSGEELWSVEFKDSGEMTNDKYPGTRGTPTVTDDSLYAVTLYGTVFCVDLQSRNVVWSRSLQHDFGKESKKFGYAQSPVVTGNMVIVAPLTKSHAVVAMERRSGEAIWTNNDYSGNGFASPVLLQVNGEEQIVVTAGGDQPRKRSRRGSSEEPAELRPTVTFAVSPKDGSLLWDYTDWSCQNPIPCPIMTGKDTLFITGGYNAQSTLLKIKKKGVDALWKTEDATSWIEQPVFVNDHLFVGGTARLKGKSGLVCVDLKGKVQWDTNEMDGAPEFEHLNMIAADGMLIGLDGKSGMLHLIEATPKKFNELASAKVVAEKGQTWAPIALSAGKLLIRDHTQMKCLNLK